MDSRKTLLQRLKGGQCASKVKTPQTFTGKLFVSKYWNRRLKVNFLQNFCGEAKQAKNEFKKTELTLCSFQCTGLLLPPLGLTFD